MTNARIHRIVDGHEYTFELTNPEMDLVYQQKLHQLNMDEASKKVEYALVYTPGIEACPWAFPDAMLDDALYDQMATCYEGIRKTTNATEEAAWGDAINTFIFSVMRKNAAKEIMKNLESRIVKNNETYFELLTMIRVHSIYPAGYDYDLLCRILGNLRVTHPTFDMLDEYYKAIHDTLENTHATVLLAFCSKYLT